MKLKIIRCTDSLMWYSKHIGKVFDVVNVTWFANNNERCVQYYWCREGGWYNAVNIVHPSDVEVFNDDLKETK